MTLQERIEWILAHRGWAQRELARRAGLSGGSIAVLLGRLKKDPEKTVDATTAIAIAQAARVNLAWMLTGEGDPEAPESGPIYVPLNEQPTWKEARSGAEALLPPGIPSSYLDDAGAYVIPERELTPYLVAKMAELLCLTERRKSGA